MRNFLLVGDRNSGKSALVHGAAKRLNFSCGGVISIPVTVDGKKVGTDALNIMTGKTATLAREGNSDGIKVGRYMLNEEGLKHGINAIYDAAGKCKLVVIDEFGPLEMGGGGMAEATDYALGKNNVLIVIRRKLKDEFLEKYRNYQFEILDARDVDVDRLAEIIENGLNRKL